MAATRTNKGANSGQLQEQFDGKTLTIEQAINTASSFTWRELEGRFQNVQSKAPVGHRVVAWFTRTESHTGSVTEEWRVIGNSAYRVEFEQLASIAARKLGYISTEAVTESWLRRVREWMIKENLDKNRELAWAPTGFVDYEGHRDTAQHLYTECIAELSAKFCVYLMTDGVPESVISPASVPLKSSPKKSRPDRRHETIQAIILSGVEGIEYCKMMDERGVKPPPEWLAQGWPGSYAAAYGSGKTADKQRWREKIQKEKTRHKNK